ncbi:D-amino-acid transaminase [Alkalihalobacillus sp. AL-G]|uniref:D-amino-acid transaminase n=1 Tax=Alkalihalobacillus sp. AL-G TaxID=2926399 RepID=UPI00272A49A3|nr:D-amino-acid transaminase [Alkalihalobacillus sp. AL-G]WLD95285.1 D-amino-acid transaminase [Alkalihalobacillus sp. AL-G]
MILLQDGLFHRSEVHIDIEDRGYQFGDGVYEVIRVYNGQFFGMAEHMERLERSAREIQLQLPYPTDLLQERLNDLINATKLKDGQVYLQVTRGVFERMHHFPVNPKSTLVAYTKETGRPLDKINQGISAITTEDIRWLRCDIKSLNLLGNVLCKQRAKEANCDEAILLRGNTVTEGSSTNVFIVKDRTLYTHPANNYILNGITRNVIIEIAKTQQLAVKEESFDKVALMSADEVMVTSTTMEITPVTTIDDLQIGSGSPGPITKQIQVKFDEKVEKLLTAAN